MRLKGRSWTIGWDLIFAILIAFPLLTGGAWIRRPGLVLELSDLAVPTLVLGALTALVHRLVDWQRSLFYRAGLRAWTFWNARLASSPLKTLLAASLGMGALWSLASLRRHWAFESHSFDLGIFTNTLWNLVHGHGYVSSPKDGINLFQDHQSPILMMFAPLFALFPAPETLLIAQALALAASGAVLFGLARPYFARGHWLPAALPILYWLYRPVRNANAFDFHPEVLMLPFFLTGLWLGQRRQRLARVGAVVAFLLALACKESAGVVAVGLGAAWMLGAGPKETRKFTRTLGLGLALSGLAVFLFDYEIVPRFFGSQYLYSGAYDQYGNGLSAVLLAPFTQPGLVIHQLVGITRLRFLFFMVAPFGFIPVLGWRALLAAVPPWLMLFLSKGDLRTSITFHYAIESAPAVFWAFILGVAVLEKRGYRRVWIYTLFFTCLLAARSEFYRIRLHSPSPHHRWLAAEVLPWVRSEASVSAPDALVPHLAMRPWIHSLTSVRRSDGSAVDCVLTDGEVNNWPLGIGEMNSLFESLPALGYREVLHCGQFRAFEREAGCFTRLPKCE